MIFSNSMQKRYVKKLKSALDKRCTGWITTSGEGAERVNCYGVHLKTDLGTINVSKFENGWITLREYPNERAEDYEEKTVEFSEHSQNDFLVTHYLGRSAIEFHGLKDLYWSELFRIPKLMRWKDRLETEVRQRRFNLKKLETMERIDLLKMLLKYNKTGRYFSSITTLMLAEHGHQYFNHPRKDEFHEETRYLLNTLKELGEISENNNGYSVNGKGYMAIVNSEEDERKHTENIMLQRKLFYLTIILAISAVAAGFEEFKLFTKWLILRSTNFLQYLTSIW